jgi:class 3 adenylate cyclase
MTCGLSLSPACPACGVEAPPRAKFCVACGTELEASSGSAAVPKTQEAGAARAAEERRQVTVLFADLSDYTALAERMDPESVKALLDRALRRLGEEVERYGGAIDKYIGDNVMAVFGAPVAHEDDPERAVRAGLGMQEAMTELNAEVGRRFDVGLTLRVGVNTGEVLAGAMGDGYTVIGDTVNVAARLQASATPGEVLVGEATYRSTRAAVEYRVVGPLALKGRAGPVGAWEATGLNASRPARAVVTETPLIGRDHELSLLQSIYSQLSRDRRPHLVTLIGQAGVGKSRLLVELDRRLAADGEGPSAVRHGHCLPYGSSLVYWALAEILRAECGILDEDPAGVAWEKLSTRLVTLLRDGGDDESESARKAGLIGGLLGIEPPGPSTSLAADPLRVRERFFAAVRSVVEARIRSRPLVLAFEDVHWADDGMLDLIEYLARWVRGPLLLLCLARDELLERRPGWGGGRRSASAVYLDPLGTDATERLVSTLLPAESDRPELISTLAERSGGNPFFAEAMVRLLEEEGSGAPDALPDTVQALLAARLDSLAPLERQVVQHGAVAGRSFPEAALEPVALGEDGDLSGALSSLEEKEILVPAAWEESGSDRELAFKHVLIRDVAYAMLPKATRARKHAEVGAFLERRAGDRSDEVVALLAQHYGRAARLAQEANLESDELRPLRTKALPFLEAAGDAAAAVYSNAEAFAHYATASGLAAEDDLPVRARIDEKQGDVALRMGRVDAALAVWTRCLDFHSGVEDLRRVGDLHRKVGAALWHKGERQQAIEHHQNGINLLREAPPCIELVRLYEEAAWLYMQTGDNMLAIYAAEKSLRLAERMGETAAVARAHGIFGRVFGRIGDTAKARENLERAAQLARGWSEAETILALLALGHHLEVFEGDYAGAERAYSEGLALAERVGDTPAQIELQTALAQISLYHGDWAGVAAAAGAATELCEREALLGKLCLPHALQGILEWREGNWAEAERLLRRSHELADQVGWSEVAFSALFGLAVVLRDSGDLDGAVGTLGQAFEVSQRAGLIAQSIQAVSARAVTLATAGDVENARKAADEAAELAERLSYPAAAAAALEAQGAATGGRDGVQRLRAARERWTAMGRVLDAARCQLLIGEALKNDEPGAANTALEAAAHSFEQLGIEHLVERSRELAST